MHGRKKNIVILVFALLFFRGGIALARQQQIVGSAAGAQINNPEISKGYYGKLDGVPAIYTIDTGSPFHLYVRVLVPQTTGVKTDFSLVVSKDGATLAKLESADSLWSVAYDPFDNDYYYQGPEFETSAIPGTYKIEISNADDQGVYVLAVGKKDVFSVSGFLVDLVELPALKTGYFNESAWGAYNNFDGLIALLAVVFTGIVSYFSIRYFSAWRLNKKLDYEYKKLRETGGANSGGLS